MKSINTYKEFTEGQTIVERNKVMTFNTGEISLCVWAWEKEKKKKKK
jgi:hypothetical protein